MHKLFYTVFVYTLVCGNAHAYCILMDIVVQILKYMSMEMRCEVGLGSKELSTCTYKRASTVKPGSCDVCVLKVCQITRCTVNTVHQCGIQCLDRVNHCTHCPQLSKDTSLSIVG